MKPEIFALVAVVACTFVGCSRSDESVGSTQSLLVAGKPAAVYDRALPEVKKQMAAGTKVVRIDDPGMITMRFSVSASDRSVRLIEVSLREEYDEKTEVSIRSKQFSFMPGRSRDEIDLSVERDLLECFTEKP